MALTPTAEYPGERIPNARDAKRQSAKRLTAHYLQLLPPGVHPPVCGIEHGQHRAALRRLADFGRTGQQLRLATAQPVHRDQHELAIERVDDLRPLERDRVVGQEIIQAGRRRPRRRLHPIARRVGPDLLGLRLLLAITQLHAHHHALRPLRRPNLEVLEDDDAALGALADCLFLQCLDRPDVRRLRHADLAMIDLEAELRHQRRLDVADHLLGLHAAPGEDVHLAHLAERRHHDARRKDTGEGRDQVLDPLHPPRIGRIAAEWQSGLIRVRRRLRRHAVSSPPPSPAVATWLRPAALARYSARSAATSTSSSFLSLSDPPPRYSATPMLAVTSPVG